MALLEISNLTVEFPTRRKTFVAVNKADLTVEPGQIHGLVGESGAGKSTIGAAVMGLLDPPGHITSGTIRFRGEEISGLDAAAMQALRGRKISMIFQDPLTSLNPLFTVKQQLVETIQEHLGFDDAAAAARAIELINRVGIPDPEIRVNQYPHQFSGGMRQRVVIALALCSEPDVIIADEPTTALDVSIQAQILDLIKELARERQVGVILITHDMGVIADTTDKVTVMYQGEVVESGATVQVLGQPDHPYTKSLIAAVPRPTVKLNRFPLISYGGRVTEFHIEDLARNWPSTEAERGSALLEVSGLTKRFLQKAALLPSRREFFTAVDNANFEIRQGEVFGLVGESGSGKSTIARMIAGLYPVDEGSVRFEGQEVTAGRRGVPDFYRKQIQMIFQDPYSSLNPRMRVDQIVAEPARHHGLLSGEPLQARVSELLDRVGLGADAGLKYPHEFSGGQRQRISIARALATQPRFLICDEPTSALDVSIQAQILNILKDLQEHLNLTMLFISHDLPVVRQMCDRVGVLKGGKLVEVADTEDLFARPQHPYTRDLLSLMPKLDGLSNEGLAVA
ncbi:ABC transporter ATP-binding protein [Boseongicola sp. H5]|uniref:dipeptide ABC transporter ATP-binding protein n=1 Tax=Rhodobacterales TaxID=204455 RepID=UPI001B195F3C|nr:ABC transporter ATP-binding protein [Boseongicola sp. H5]MBO6603124.1 ABC transporter ATP-binding protein [Roseicyclus sp.]MBO6626334.1 ABC transporter ATP-binding protein [Roseicyclus sp.]MBO6920996.1 ABC transporter ATP-binding protein [Roseicyclus sp.]